MKVKEMVMVMVRRDLMEVVMIKILLRPWKEIFCRRILMSTGMECYFLKMQHTVKFR